VTKRFFGELTITLSDGYVERCIIRERREKRFLERLKENVQIILENDPKAKRNITLNYRGYLAAEIYDCLKKKESEGLKLGCALPSSQRRIRPRG